jgi:cytochrome c oxidase subunit 3
MRSDEPVIAPGTIILTLVLTGISALFVGTSGAYFYSLYTSGAKAPLPPIIFLVNIPVLSLATVSIRKAKSMYATAYGRSQKALIICLFLTVVFTVLQVWGWSHFFRNLPFHISQPRSYLFLLSAMHLTHVIAGMPFLVWFQWIARPKTTISRRTDTWLAGYLQGLVRYWRFIDILWILLVFMLWLGYAATRLL